MPENPLNELNLNSQSLATMDTIEDAPGHEHHAGCSHGHGHGLESQVPHINVFKNVGRNDPCPCSSGKKYKKCCLLLR